MLALGRDTVGQLIRYGVSSGASAAVSLGLPVLLHDTFGVEHIEANIGSRPYSSASSQTRKSRGTGIVQFARKSTEGSHRGGPSLRPAGRLGSYVCGWASDI